MKPAQKDVDRVKCRNFRSMFLLYDEPTGGQICHVEMMQLLIDDHYMTLSHITNLLSLRKVTEYLKGDSSIALM